MKLKVTIVGIIIIATVSGALYNSSKINYSDKSTDNNIEVIHNDKESNLQPDELNVAEEKNNTQNEYPLEDENSSEFQTIYNEIESIDNNSEEARMKAIEEYREVTGGGVIGKSITITVYEGEIVDYKYIKMCKKGKIIKEAPYFDMLLDTFLDNLADYLKENDYIVSPGTYKLHQSYGFKDGYVYSPSGKSEILKFEKKPTKEKRGFFEKMFK